MNAHETRQEQNVWDKLLPGETAATPRPPAIATAHPIPATANGTTPAAAGPFTGMYDHRWDHVIPGRCTDAAALARDPYAVSPRVYENVQREGLGGQLDREIGRQHPGTQLPPFSEGPSVSVDNSTEAQRAAGRRVADWMSRGEEGHHDPHLPHGEPELPRVTPGPGVP